MQSNSAQQNTLIWGGVLALLAALLWLLGAVLMPFVVAAVLAYALNPLVNGILKLTGQRVPRVMAVIFVEILFILICFSLLMLVVPVVTHEIPRVRTQFPDLLEHLQVFLTPYLAAWGVEATFDVETLKNLVLQGMNTVLDDGLPKAFDSIKIGGSLALAIIGNLVLIPVVLFYLLLDWKVFVRHVESLIPLPWRDSYDSFLAECDQVLGQYLRGQLSVMGLLAIYYSAGLSLFGLELALPIGIFTGLAVFVPYVGFGMGLLLSVFAGVLQFGFMHTLLMIAVVFGVGQLIEGFVLTPRLVGERIGLHPLHVIFALLAFGQIFGFIGVLVALPVSAVLLVAIRRLRVQYQASRLYRGNSD
jgi:predicted PurR-regulated permease PerM